jgi:hypothetical protein
MRCVIQSLFATCARAELYEEQKLSWRKNSWVASLGSHQETRDALPLKFLMSVLEYIEETNPTEVRELLTAAPLFLQETLPPFATCAIKWRIPFYSLRRNFCYLNRHRDHITLGFPHGYKLAPQPGVLLGESENLKQVRYLEICSVEGLYSEETLQILHEAILLDETMAKVKPTFKGKDRRCS